MFRPATVSFMSSIRCFFHQKISKHQQTKKTKTRKVPLHLHEAVVAGVEVVVVEEVVEEETERRQQ